jgi:gamma-glutamylcyclotransferase (GGCT)/AIG2-like uncharacterized protein YtfP
LAHLFVYGSLKRGGLHHDELGEAVFLGTVATAPGYRLERLGEYLALVSQPGPAGETPSVAAGGGDGLGVVSGELFYVPVSLSPLLVEFEGEAYVRCDVRLE